MNTINFDDRFYQNSEALHSNLVQIEEKVKEDRNIALQSIKISCSNITSIPTELFADKIFLLELLTTIHTINKEKEIDKIPKSILRHIHGNLSKNLAQDRDFILKAVAIDGLFQFLSSETLHNDKEIALITIKSAPHRLHCLPRSLKTNPSFLLQAIAINPQVILDISPKFLKKISFVAQATALNPIVVMKQINKARYIHLLPEIFMNISLMANVLQHSLFDAKAELLDMYPDIYKEGLKTATIIRLKVQNTLVKDIFMEFK